MNIDVRTLLIVHSLVSLALAVLMVVFWRGHRNTPGLGQWTLASALLGLSVLGGGLRGVIPDFVSIVGANVVGVIAVGSYWNGIRLFDGRPARWTGVLLAAAGIAAVLVHQTYVVNDLLNRVIVISAVLSLGCMLCAYELVRGPARTLRTPGLLAAALFAIVASTLAFRAISTIMIAARTGSLRRKHGPEYSFPRLAHLQNPGRHFAADAGRAAPAAQLEARNTDLELRRESARRRPAGPSPNSWRR